MSTTQNTVQSAFRLLSTQLGIRVRVLLTEGGYIIGILRGFDLHMNVVLEDAELVTDEMKIKIGNLVLRGAAIIAITTLD
ncbi:MAG: LSM domain-containing protein [Candidatus Asgardarchaeia archaeon]